MGIVTGWLDDLTKWLKDAIAWLFGGIVDVLKDLVLGLLHLILDAFLYIISLIPVPDFITSNTIGGMLGSAGPVIGWLGGTLNVGACFAMIAAGYGFRLLRKLVTLGQW